jgi:hypothetical protein
LKGPSFSLRSARGKFSLTELEEEQDRPRPIRTSEAKADKMKEDRGYHDERSEEPPSALCASARVKVF